MEEEKTVSEAVNHPSHYQSANGIEVIDVMDAFTEGLEGIEAVDTAQVIKYICRWKKKNGLEDLKKAKWYIDHLINKVSNQRITEATLYVDEMEYVKDGKTIFRFKDITPESEKQRSL